MKRLDHLDVLRGVALLGILPVNIAFFALPSSEGWELGATSPGATDLDVFASNLVTVAASEKFLTLFSLLFGMGMMLLRQRAEERDEPFAPVITRRLFVLWGLGLLHATLLWYGDVVSVYAPIGLVVCWAGAWRPRTLLWAGIGLLCAPAVCCGGGGLLLALVDDGSPDAVVGRVLDAGAPWGRFVADCVIVVAEGENNVPGASAFETAVFRDGSLARIVVLRSVFWGFSMLGVAPFLRLAAGRTVPGGDGLDEARLVRRPGRPARRLPPPVLVGSPRRSAAAGRGAVVPRGERLRRPARSAPVRREPGPGVRVRRCRVQADRPVGPLPWARTLRGRGAHRLQQLRRPVGPLQRPLLLVRLRAVRTAGNGRAPRREAAIWAVQLAASALWMRRFAYGPLEWGWRCLTYGRRLPFKREAT